MSVSAPQRATPAVQPAAPLVRADGLAVRIGDRTIWEDVTVRVDAGEFAAILGPNGVGKSTLLKVLLGLLPASKGSVSVLGQRPGQAGPAIGYLPQRRSFDPGVWVRGVDVVRLGLDGHRWGLPLGGRRHRQATAARVAEVIDLVGAGDYARRPIGQLSGGEQQRLLLAQALAPAPQLLLLDEPLDSLDLPNQAAAAALISRICTEQQVSVLLVAHDVNPILTYLDQVIYLGAHGAASGTPAEVITTETLTRLYGTPVEVLRARDGRLVVVGHPETPPAHGDRHA